MFLSLAVGVLVGGGGWNDIIKIVSILVVASSFLAAGIYSLSVLPPPLTLSLALLAITTADRRQWLDPDAVPDAVM